jgi:TPR repeat protein
MQCRGYIYQNGLQVPRNYFQALEFYRHGCNQDVSISCNNLGTLYHGGFGVPRDDERAVAG